MLHGYRLVQKVSPGRFIFQSWWNNSLPPVDRHDRIDSTPWTETLFRCEIHSGDFISSHRRRSPLWRRSLILIWRLGPDSNNVCDQPHLRHTTLNLILFPSLPVPFSSSSFPSLLPLFILPGYPLFWFCDFRIQGLFRTFSRTFQGHSYDNHAHSKRCSTSSTPLVYMQSFFHRNRIITCTLKE